MLISTKHLLYSQARNPTNMNEQEHPRRKFIKESAVLGFGTAIPNIPGIPKLWKGQTNVITEENALEGSTDWQLTRVRPDSSAQRTPWIEGYCNRQSVRAGDTLEVMIATDPVREYFVEIFRTGYYNGAGARLVKKLGPLPGIKQPVPEMGEKNIHECQWDPSFSLRIEDEWVSGV